jgi:molybdate transport system substrate-binding protein
MKRLVVAVALLAAACGGGGHREIVVFAAASLNAPFRQIAATFERAHHAHVRLSFGPSDGLARQVEDGAPADVFASASERWADEVARAPGLLDRRDFARNSLAVLVPTDNPAHVRGVSDLTRVKLVLAAEGVPAGDYARAMLRQDRLLGRVHIVSNEADVAGVVQKVASGDADAGIAYVTDATDARVTAIAIPKRLNVIATYPIAIVRSTRHAALARAFVDTVSGSGQQVLKRYGFLPAA